MAKISVVINTLNEERNIRDCILSTKAIADEIIVCDMSSEDRTREIAAECGAKVFVINRMEGQYQKMRHDAIEMATNEWVLQIDADERLTKKLAEKLKELAEDHSIEVVMFGILFWYFGGWVRHGGFFNSDYYRFFRRSTYLSNYRENSVQAHHDMSSLKGLHGVVRLPKEYYLLHLAYETIEKYVVKTVGMYSRIEAEQMKKSGQRFKTINMVTKPLLKFFRVYVLRKAYKDGLRGLILSIYFSLYIFSIWSNLWFLEQSQSNAEYLSDEFNIL